MSDLNEDKKTRLIDETDIEPLTEDEILEIMEGDGEPELPPNTVIIPLTNDEVLDAMEGDGSSELPDDMPEDYEGDVTDEDIWKMLEDETK